MSSNRLLHYFRHNKGRQIYKWLHYFDIYDEHFRQYRKKKVTVVEFGVLHGGSLQMWKHYFGRRARIIGVDNEPECKKLEEKQIEIFIGDQADRHFLKELREEIGQVDIVIDDGGHIMRQQLNTFKEMWPAVKEGGKYVVEDLHTSYAKMYGGGYKKAGTFIEFTKDLIDQINAWQASRVPVKSPSVKRLRITNYTRTIKAIHSYTSLVIFDKGHMTEPYDEQTGKPSDIDFHFLGWGVPQKKK